MAAKTFACGWCYGTRWVKIPCPARHHDHDITVPCGRCGATGDERCNWTLVRAALEDREIWAGVSRG